LQTLNVKNDYALEVIFSTRTTHRDIQGSGGVFWWQYLMPRPQQPASPAVKACSLLLTIWSN